MNFAEEVIALQDYDYEVIVDSRKYHDAAERVLDLSRYMGRGEKMFHTDAQEYIRELRNCDRD